MPEAAAPVPAASVAGRGDGRVYVVVLNWNAWALTIECLESLAHLQGVAWTAVVADNGSSDGSRERIQAWAAGQLAVTPAPFLGQAACTKPLSLAMLSRASAAQALPAPPQVVFIETGENLGFAGGCNVGIRFAMAQPDCAHVWVLNNDCVVEPGSLKALVDLCAARPKLGMCGSQIRYYEKPAMVQTFGGLLSPWFCTVHNIACGVDASQLPPDPADLGYVPGASILVTRAFLETIGPMSEDYFLYYEEPDWAERARGRFEMAVTRHSIVYHRGGASSGTPSENSQRGLRSNFFMLRSRARFARKYFRGRLPVVYLGLLGSVCTRLLRRHWRRAFVAACAVLEVVPPGLQLPPAAVQRGR